MPDVRCQSPGIETSVMLIGIRLAGEPIHPNRPFARNGANLLEHTSAREGEKFK